MRRTRTIGLVIATAIVGVGVLAACSSSNEGEPMSSDQPAVVDGPSDEQLAFLDALVAQEPALDSATEQIEAAGYTWRLGTIDGEDQALTMDYRLDRLTLTVDNGIVTAAVWG